MQFTIIAALSENYVIGNKGKIPWHIPEDMKRFKKMTFHHHVILGRKTYEEIVKKLEKPLPQRTSIVLTRDKKFYNPTENIVIKNSFESVVQYCSEQNLENAFVIGGRQIYKQFIPLAQRMELTLVEGNYLGDAFFPKVNWNEWQEVERHDKQDYSFVSYQRK